MAVLHGAARRPPPAQQRSSAASEQPRVGQKFSGAPVSRAPAGKEQLRKRGRRSATHGRVFLTFPGLSVEVGGVHPASGSGLTPTAARREGLIGGVRGSHLFPLEQGRTAARRRSGSASGTCPLPPPSLSSLLTHVHKHTERRNAKQVSHTIFFCKPWLWE